MMETVVRIVWGLWLLQVMLPRNKWPDASDGVEKLAHFASVLGLALILLNAGPTIVTLPPEYAAACLIALAWGMWLAIWARVALGMWWAPMRHAGPQAIVTEGPYKAMKHPLYVGCSIAAVASAFLMGGTSAFLGAILLVAGLYIKAQKETPPGEQPSGVVV
jgi:protein-S-isoprenylcysteine O-methyltransferase Ste14